MRCKHKVLKVAHILPRGIDVSDFKVEKLHQQHFQHTSKNP